MATLRTRLTVTYGAALIGGLIVFAVALYVVRVASGVDANAIIVPMSATV